MNDDLLILLGTTGSVRWGMNTKESDVDIRGVFLQSFQKYIGLPSNLPKIRITQDNKNDTKLWDARTFGTLLAKGDPESHRFLWIPGRYRRVMSNQLGRALVDNRHKFVGKELLTRCMAEARGRLEGLRKKPDKNRDSQIRGIFLSLADVASLLGTSELVVSLSPIEAKALQLFRSGGSNIEMFMDWAEKRIRTLSLEIENSPMKSIDLEYLNWVLITHTLSEWKAHNDQTGKALESSLTDPQLPRESTGDTEGNDPVRQDTKELPGAEQCGEEAEVPSIRNEGNGEQAEQGPEPVHDGHRTHGGGVPDGSDQSGESPGDQDQGEEHRGTTDSPSSEGDSGNPAHYGPP